MVFPRMNLINERRGLCSKLDLVAEMVSYHQKLPVATAYER